MFVFFFTAVEVARNNLDQNQIEQARKKSEQQISTVSSPTFSYKPSEFDFKEENNNNAVSDPNNNTNNGQSAPPNGELMPPRSKKSLWSIPQRSKLGTFWWFYIWPAKFLLTMTIPNPKTFPRLYPVTFIMCIIWIGLNSYLIVWMVVRIGETFGIPDSVMGLTFLAAGGCLPEAISSVIMARKGKLKIFS